MPGEPKVPVPSTGPPLGNVQTPDSYLRIKQNIEGLQQDAGKLRDFLAASRPLTLDQIQKALQAGGPNPLNLTGLPGIVLQPQKATVLHGTRAQRLANYPPANYPEGTLFYEDDTGLLWEDHLLSGVKKWIIIQPVVSPFAFGAVGNGVVDDTAALTQALAAASYLWLPAGYTFLSGKLTITTANTLITGGGCLKAKANLNDDLLLFDGSANASGSFFRVLGVEINGNGAAQSSGTGACVALRNGAYAIVDQNYIHDSKGDGIRVENYGNSSVADEVNIIDNRIFSNARHGIYLVPVTTGSGYGRVGDHLIVSNHINYNGGSGIRATYLTSSIIALNNLLTNTAHGAFCDAADRCQFLSNAARNNGGNGIYVDEETSVGFGRSNDILIEGNELHYNGADECDVWHTDRLQFLGNYCGDTDFTARAQYGLQLSLDTSVVICNNIFYNTVHGALLSNGVPYKAFGNIGFSGGTEPMSGNQASLPTLNANDSSFLYYVTDYAHLLQWGGNGWNWGPGDPGSGMMVLFEVDPTGNGWHLYDGNNVSYLRGNGTLGNITLPDLISGNSNAAYLKAGTPNSGPNAAVAPVFSGNAGNLTATFAGDAANLTANFTGNAFGFTQANFLTTLSLSPATTTATYTPTGTVAVGNYTPSGNVTAGNYTPTGTVSANGEPRNLVRRPWFRQ